MSNRPGTATLYAGIRRLKPGAVLLLDRDGVREERYWAPRFEEPLERVRAAARRAGARGARARGARRGSPRMGSPGC